MAGKPARCKKCSNEFFIPTPLETTGPRSSEAIPISPQVVVEPPAKGPLPRSTRAEGRTTGPPTKPQVAEPSRPAPLPRISRIEPEPAPSSNAEHDDHPWPDYVFTKPVEKVSTQSPTPAPVSTTARPRWFKPAIAGGVVAAVLALNLGVYFTFFGGASEPTDRAEPAPETPGATGPMARQPKENAPLITAPAPPRFRKPTEPKGTARPVAEPSSAGETTGARTSP